MNSMRGHSVSTDDLALVVLRKRRIPVRTDEDARHPRVSARTVLYPAIGVSTNTGNVRSVRWAYKS